MNIKEIAKLAGVSTSTVSKIVNQKDESISSETRERVLKIVREYNYTPYASAAVNTQKTWTLGILLRSTVSSESIAKGIIHAAQECGYVTIICDSCSDPEQELKNITALCGSHADGVIWEPVNEQSLSNAVHFQKQNIPFITTGAFGDDNSINLPYESLGYHLTRQLIDQKHTNIACLLSKERGRQDFLSGYRNCLFDNQLQMHESLVFNTFDKSLAYKINTHQISGIVSSNYLRALELYQFMNALHYRIPEDFSLISLRNDYPVVPDLPKISSIAVSKTKFGEYLCKKLIAQIEKSDKEPEPFIQEFTLDHTSTITVPSHLNMPKIVVVGSINMDTYLNVEHLPDTGKTVSTSTSSMYPGGKGINQAIGVSKLGHHVVLIGNVGSDIDSDNIYKTLHEYGVDTYGIKRCFHTNTGKAYIFVESSGNSMISILAGANGIFTPEDIREKAHLFENTGYCLIQSEIPIETVLEACLTARKYNVKTIFKPSASRHFPAELLSCVDIIIPNEDELNLLCPDQSTIQEKADHLLHYGISTVIVTLGERGCYAKTKDWEETFSAAAFTSVDNTGASDAFISALASYLLYGYSLKDSIRIATYAAGFSVTREGVVPALIDRNSLESYITKTEPLLLRTDISS